MIELLITLCIFFVTIAAHVMAYRSAAQSGRAAIATILVFFFGYVAKTMMLHYVTHTDYLSVAQISTDFIFLLLILDYLAAITSPILGDESPSSKIVFTVMKGKTRKKDIIRAFSGDSLIEKRLQNMVDTGLIRKSGSSYYALPKGDRIGRIIQAYRNFLKWDNVG